MSPITYVPPGVSISETVSPQFNPDFVDPNVIAFVGPSQGYQTHVETVLLNDNTPYTLSASYPDISTISVVDATNVTLTPFVASTPTQENDYDIDITNLATQGTVSLARAMQTTIPNGQRAWVYLENSGSANQGNSFTDFIVLNGTTSAVPTHAVSGTQAGTLTVGSPGVVPTSDYTVAGAGGATPTIVWSNTAAVISKFQTVYLNYVVGDVVYSNVPVQLNNLTTVSLTANADSIVVQTEPNSPITNAVKYEKGTSTDLDYIVTGSGATTAIARSAGSTSMGTTIDKQVVRITYQATPVEYWLPTRCYSQGDVESKYGPAFDSSGNISSPVSFASSLAFAGGLSSVIIQALFTEGTPRTQPSGTTGDWSNTLANLYSVDILTAVVPLIATGGLTTNDGLNLEILTLVQNFCNYMGLQQQQLIIGICGEDSTGGVYAAQATLQAHAQSLSAGSPAESIVLVDPAAFTMTNPITGQSMTVGGQYAAAGFAGMFGQYPVQMPLTRKTMPVFTGIKDIRTTADKNADAQAGLCVIEFKNNLVRVRDAITVATDTQAHQQLNVIRAEYYMMQTLVSDLDTQLIGQIVIDANATFLTQLAINNILEGLVTQGVIVSFENIQVRRDPNSSTALQAQFSYLPAFALNNIAVAFSIDTSAGVTVANTSALTTQGT